MTKRNATFAYSPDIAVYVMDKDQNVIDLSRDIESFSLIRRPNVQSEFHCRLNNKYNKYDRVIPRMSRIVVFLKRTSWVQEFSGYTTNVPYKTVVPGSVALTAHCTLKRVANIYWDPHSQVAADIFPGTTSAVSPSSKKEEGGAAAALFRLLTKVAKWPKDKIHIQRIPYVFLRRAAELASAMKDEIDPRILEAMNNVLDANGVPQAGVSNQMSAVDAGVYSPQGAKGASGNTSPISGQSGVSPAVISFENAVKSAFPKIQTMGNVSVRPINNNPANGWSQHAYGNASDLYLPGQDASSPEPGRPLWEWIKKNRAAFNIHYAVFYIEEMIGSISNGKLSYRFETPESGQASLHRNHIHIDHYPQWTGDPPGRPDNTTLPTGVDPGVAPPTDPYTSGPFWGQSYGVGMNFNDVLSGIHSFINDESILETLRIFAQASMREFQSAPNGDFVAWFPDKWGFYGKAPTLKVRDIEIQNFALSISDSQLVTHVAAVGDTSDPLTGFAGQGSVDIFDQAFTFGIVSVENEQAMKLLMGLDPKKEYEGVPGKATLQRYGLRPDVISLPMIRDHAWEFTFALHHFMRKWSEQFLESVTFTFLPELYPGMLVELEDQGIRFYVESVTHQGAREGQGWTTEAAVSSPMVRDAQGKWVMLAPEGDPQELPEDVETIVARSQQQVGE